MDNPDQDQVNNLNQTTPQQENNDTEMTHEPTTEAAAPIEIIQAPPIQPIVTPELIKSDSPLSLILQWLTYAFWLASTVSVTILTGFISYYFLSGDNDSTSPTTYAIAAVVSFVIFAVICDLLYIKKEPTHKIKGASAIMIVHAVIFALGGVGALFTIIFNLVTLVTGENIGYGYQDYTTTVNILAALSGLVFCVILFFRTIATKRIFNLRKIIVIVLALLSMILVGLGVSGPIVNLMANKDDRLIETSLSQISSDISSYSYKNKSLPATLENLSLSDSINDLVSRNKITYKIEANDQNSYYYYQLCADFKSADTTSKYIKNYYNSSSDERSSYVDTTGHPAGSVCYKLQTSGPIYY